MIVCICANITCKDLKKYNTIKELVDKHPNCIRQCGICSKYIKKKMLSNNYLTSNYFNSKINNNKSQLFLFFCVRLEYIYVSGGKTGQNPAIHSGAGIC